LFNEYNSKYRQTCRISYIVLVQVEMDSPKYVTEDKMTPSIQHLWCRMHDVYLHLNRSDILKNLLLISMSVALMMFLLNLPWILLLLLIIIVLLRLLYIALTNQDIGNRPLDPNKLSNLKNVYRNRLVNADLTVGGTRHQDDVRKNETGSDQLHNSDRKATDIQHPNTNV